MMNMENINNMVSSGVESASQMSIGQAILRLIDRILWVVEKSVQWSLPTQELTTEENGKTFNKVELVRPLPWILFLPGLFMLRLIRNFINVAASILGYPKLEPTDMVIAIQRGRRRVRAIKSSGLKSMRLKKAPVVKDSTMTMKEVSKRLAKSIRLTLSTLSCLDSGSKTSPSPPPTKIRVSHILDPAPLVSEEKSAGDSALTSPVHPDSKRKFSEISTEDSSENETDEEPLISKIDRLANASGSDRDFSPGEYSSSDEGDSTDSDADVSIALSEVQELKLEDEDAENTDKLSDNKLHKLTEKLVTAEKLGETVYGNGPQQFLSPHQARAEKEKLHLITANGIPTDADTKYFSPVSWKSLSPEVSTSPDKLSQFDMEKNREEISNGEIKSESESIDCDSTKPCIEDSQEVANGLSKEKQRTSSNSGGSNKHHQKNKRGNHGNRKKK